MRIKIGVLLRKSTILGVFVIISYIILFFGLFGELPVVRAGVGLLVIMDMLAFLLTIPPEYLRWRGARMVIQRFLAGSGISITGYSQLSHRTINMLLTGFLYSAVMIAMVVLLGAILPLPNMGLSILICLLSGWLIVRMQLAYELEAEGNSYFSRPAH